MKKRKNPPPQFFKQLIKLVNSNVRIQLGSDYGFFAVSGNLHQFGSIYTIKFFDKNISFEILFKIALIENILSNIIILKSIPYKRLPNNLDHQQLIGFINKNISININTYYFQDFGIPESYLYAKLKYDKKQNLFYVLNKDSSIFLRFKLEAVKNIWSYHSLDIEI